MFLLLSIFVMVVNESFSSRMKVKSNMQYINFPIKFAYVNKILDWSSATGIATSMGVPGYSNHSYNYICLAFWTCSSGPLDTALLWNNPSAYIGTSSAFGTNNNQIRTKIKSLYNNAGIKLMVSAFGATEYPTSQGLNALQCAKKLADYVTANQLDGVDIDWEDTAAFNSPTGGGQAWLITLTTQLRTLLPNAIITHAPQAPYFGGKTLYPNNGYLAVDKAVGSSIQFYNVQFYNQGSTGYNTSNSLFNVSGGWAPRTSVNQIIASGVPMSKIVVGKPATTIDANPASYMTPAVLNSTFVAAYKFNQWKTGVMFWQLSSDPKGAIVQQSVSGLLLAITPNSTNNTTTNSTTNSSITNSTTNNTKNSTTNSTTNSTNNSTKNQTLNSTTNTTNSSNYSLVINYPIKFTCINKIINTSSDANILKSLANPSSSSGYNYISLYSWSYRSASENILLIWANPRSYFSSAFAGSSSNSQLRTKIKANYIKYGVKLLVHVFGSSQMPTTAGYDPVQVAINLALFVTSYNLDGVDIDYQDSIAFNKGNGEQWLFDFTIKLRSLLPNSLIVHTVNAGYFVGKPIFKNGAYVTVNSKVGSLIDFYNVRYFSQSTSTYNTSQSLFNVSNGWAANTSVNQLIAKGISSKKIVVGKTATANLGSTSYMTAAQLKAAITLQYQKSGWNTGVMVYEFASDPNGTFIKTVTQPFPS